jgi:hypothetical protein
MEKDQIGILIIESDTVEQNQIAQLFQGNPLISFVEISEDTDAALLKIIDSQQVGWYWDLPWGGKRGLG